MSGLALAVLVLVAGGLTVPDRAQAPDAGARAPTPTTQPAPATQPALQARFFAALKKGGSPELATVAAAEAELAAIARENPDDDLAPEALYEAAQLCEGRLGRLEAAAAHYQALISGYPASRLLRRAENRLADLRSGLSTGEKPLQEFHEILRTTEENSAARAARLRELLKAHPDFALADRALYLVGAAAEKAGDFSESERALVELARRFPDSEWSAQGHKLHGDSLLARGRPIDALAHYQALSRFAEKSPLWQSLRDASIFAAERALSRRKWALASLGGLVVWGLFLLARARRFLLPVPFEVVYLAPVSGLFVGLSAALKGGIMLAPVTMLSLGGLVIAWLLAAHVEFMKKEAAGQRRIGALILLLGFALLSGVALLYLTAYQHGLIDLIIETLKNGPED